MVYGSEPEPPRPGFALVKYGFILIIVIVVLGFIARYILPLLTDGEEGGPDPAPPTAMRLAR
ncbi:MAG: hypothetical protein ACRDIX_03605 [Actinomycetota bacterium]